MSDLHTIPLVALALVGAVSWVLLALYPLEKFFLWLGRKKPMATRRGC